MRQKKLEDFPELAPIVSALEMVRERIIAERKEAKVRKAQTYLDLSCAQCNESLSKHDPAYLTACLFVLKTEWLA